MISIIISTRNRQEKLENCLSNILNSNYENYEILVLDQSDKKTALKIKNKKIKYFYTLNKGVGKARNLNLGIKKAKGSIIAFTDDDCIVSSDWLKQTEIFFKKNPKIAGVFGNTLPFEKTKRKNSICPATFKSEKLLIVDNSHTMQHHTLGQGNNMAFRKRIFKQIGPFKTWLGVGSICKAGEDTDIIFRLLKSNVKLANNPKMIIYHNRWLSFDEENKLQADYTLGFVATYFYHFCKSGDFKLLGLISKRLKERIPYKIESLLRRFNKKDLIFIFLEFKAVLFGILMGIFFQFV